MSKIEQELKRHMPAVKSKTQASTPIAGPEKAVADLQKRYQTVRLGTPGKTKALKLVSAPVKFTCLPLLRL